MFAHSSIAAERKTAVLKPMLFAVLLAGIVMTIALLVTFLTPIGVAKPSTPIIEAGLVASFAVREPQPIDAGHLWLVRLDETHWLALSWRDPYRGCTVPWRSTYEFKGTTGWFRNPCSGATYDIEGRCVFGPCFRGLDRYEVNASRGNVYVDLSTLTKGAPAPDSEVPLIAR